MRNCVRGGKGGVSSASFLSWYWLFLRRHEDAQRHKTCDKVRTQTPSPQSQAEVQYLDPNSLFCNMSIIGGALKKNGWMTLLKPNQPKLLTYIQIKPSDGPEEDFMANLYRGWRFLVHSWEKESFLSTLKREHLKIARRTTACVNYVN